jgi:hypothetical protein
MDRQKTAKKETDRKTNKIVVTRKRIKKPKRTTQAMTCEEEERLQPSEGRNTKRKTTVMRPSKHAIESTTQKKKKEKETNKGEKK